MILFLNNKINVNSVLFFTLLFSLLIILSMDTWFQFICEYSSEAYWIIFILLMLGGLNFPLSEDLLVITCGAIARFCLSGGDRWHLYLWIYAGSWISAWEAYGIARWLGPKLYTIAWFKRVFSHQRIEKLHYYYEKFGVLTFIVGRFCPGGIRNALFMSSGLGKMPFLLFIARDGFACLLSSFTLYSIGYIFADNYQVIADRFQWISLIFFGLFLAVAIGIGLYYRRTTKNSK